VPEEPSQPKDQPRAAKIQLDVITDPAGATVHVGSTAFGPTPVAVMVEPGQRMLISLDGHRPQFWDVTGKEGGTLTLTLAKTSTVQ
jgi:hypothetical protein